MYLPTKSAFTEALMRSAHLTTLHGGVGSSITKIKEHYWVPKLRQLTKEIGEVMMIKGNKKNKSHWKLRIFKGIIAGRDGVVRGAKLRAGNATLSQAHTADFYRCDMRCLLFPVAAHSRL